MPSLVFLDILVMNAIDCATIELLEDYKCHHYKLYLIANKIKDKNYV